ncbi:MAG: hypothetical protein V4671_00465 [Armatimonadota bacterium]
MKRQTILVAGLIGLIGLAALPGVADAAELRDTRAQSKPRAAVLAASERIAIIDAAFAAVHKTVQIDVRKRNGDLIPRRFWGPAIEKLRPLRVINDRMNVRIVLTDDSRNEKGLYVGNYISSYSGPDSRDPAYELLSKPGERSGGTLYRYHIRKQPSPTRPRKASVSAAEQ